MKRDAPQVRFLPATPPFPTQRLRSSTRQSCRLLIGGLQVQLLPGPPLEGLPLARYPVSKTGAASAVGGSTPSPSARSSSKHSVPARSNGYDARLLIAKSRFEPCRRSSSVGGRCPWRHGSLITSRAWFDSRTSDQVHMPPWSSGCDAGFSTRRRGFKSRRGYSRIALLAVGEHGHPAGFGSRRSQVRLLPARLAR